MPSLTLRTLPKSDTWLEKGPLSKHGAWIRGIYFTRFILGAWALCVIYSKRLIQTPGHSHAQCREEELCFFEKSKSLYAR